MHRKGEWLFAKASKPPRTQVTNFQISVSVPYKINLDINFNLILFIEKSTYMDHARWINRNFPSFNFSKLEQC